MNGRQKHKIRFKLKILRLKNSVFLSFIDKVIKLIKPPKVYNGNIKKILFIRSDRIGDAFVTLPVLRNIKLNYPDVLVHVITSGKNRFVFDNVQYIDKIFTFGTESKLRRVFEFNEGYSKTNISKFEQKLMELFLIGHFFHFLIFCFFPYFFSSNLRNEISSLKSEAYDIVFDLKGSKRIAIVSKMISKFTAGSRMFGFSWLYTYYADSSWVSGDDKVSMSEKIENFITKSSGLTFKRLNQSIPYYNIPRKGIVNKNNDLFFHIGTTELRKLAIEQELQILNSLKGKKVIITDSAGTGRFNSYQRKFEYNFKLYERIEDCSEDVLNSRLVLCYDGGQAHFLSQMSRTITIFGPGSVHLWKPYEFEDYEPYLTNDTHIMKSKGKFGHFVIFLPIWCSPCFDIGCRTKPCLTALDVNKLIGLIREILI